MRALVTGGAGFIGSNLTEALLARGDEVVVLDDLSSGFEKNIPPGARFVRGAVEDPSVVAEAVTGCEVVFHQAAHRAVFRSVEHPLATDCANIGGTLTVLVAARDAGARRVVYASSSSVYGGAEVLPTSESEPLVPRSPYAVTKLAGEHYCRVVHELFGLETVALRYFNVYGPRQRPESEYAAVIPRFIDALRTGTPPEVHGDGRQSRDFTYIADVVASNLAAMEAPAERCAGRAYNIAAGKAHSLLELLELLSGILGVEVEPRHTAERAGDVKHTHADCSAARDDLTWEAHVDFGDGLRRTVSWFLEQ